ncbi:Hydrolase, alpha/beta fold family [hydrothermal vent metagenome]|uniref:Hydrolase, alpha/beta fold family n=1 Tax=hydrothermal vent metagenome TaxID=652676 RepID=A0A3B1CS09_9ZZZZ
MQLTINGLQVFTEGDKSNRPIIFVHGFPYDHTMWDKQIDHLKDNYYCVTYDIRGLGKSAVGNGQYTMESYVDDLFKIIAELELTKPALCGLSMGGYISFRAVERSQETFGSLIICDTRAEADSNEGKLVRASKIKQINEEGIEAFVESFVPTCFAVDTIENRSELFQSVLNKCKTNDPIGVKGALIAMLSRTDTTNYLSKIKIPTLIIVGENDVLTPPAVMKTLHENIPNSEFVIISKAGHMTPIEEPEAVNEVMKEFLT